MIMKMIPVDQVKTTEQAEQLAIDWQQWAGEQNEIVKEPTLFTSDLVDWAEYFTKLGNKFGLIEVFTENGII